MVINVEDFHQKALIKKKNITTKIDRSQFYEFFYRIFFSEVVFE